MCGENSETMKQRRRSLGSSPRVRGKRSRRRAMLCAGRLIPACAGKTRLRAARAGAEPAHPRVCGENLELGVEGVEVGGSSPRVRGKHVGDLGVLVRGGLIPACAGKTSPPGPRSGRSAAHPRVCGENVEGCRAAPWPVWLIPACAGKTLECDLHVRRSSAHPRVCGENPVMSSKLRYERGSSPRVRGKPFNGRHLCINTGLIPACAGKTFTGFWDLLTGIGSSPRVRGKLVLRARGGDNARLIPACAGKTRNWELGSTRARLIPACAGKTIDYSEYRAPGQAHPRVCGENRNVR